MSRLICPLSAVLLSLTLAPSAQPAAPPGNLDRHGDPLPRGSVVRLGSVRFRLGYASAPLAVSPDGKRVFVSSGQGTLGVFDVATGKMRRLPLPKAEGDVV